MESTNEKSLNSKSLGSNSLHPSKTTYVVKQTKRVASKALTPTGAGLGDAPLPNVTLRVFVDRSVVEAYCGGAAITGRSYAESPRTATRIGVFAEGASARLLSADVWHLGSMWHPPPAAPVPVL